MMLPLLLSLAVLFILPASLGAQTLDERIGAVHNGTFRLSFAARPDVCGDGRDNVSLRQVNEEWEDDCESQLVRVALQIRDRRVIGLRTMSVADGARAPPPKTSVQFAPRTPPPFFLAWRAEQARSPAIRCCLRRWPTALPSGRRCSDWREAGTCPRRDAAPPSSGWDRRPGLPGEALDSIVTDDGGDREVRKQAVFSLSQRSTEEAVPALIRIARSNPDPELRKTALFWLGQSDDPRALDLFEEILR
jgi:hypothetical protein